MVNLVDNFTFHRKYALTAGLALIIMALTAAFSNGYVLGNLVISNDPSATFNNIRSATELFNAGIFGWLVILICDVIVTWTLFIILKPINKNLSILGAILRLIYTAILTVSILNLVYVSLLLSGTNFYSLITNQQLQALTWLFLEGFEYIWFIGLVIFGGHLFVVGYLAFQSKKIPKIISILLIIASFGYMSIHLFSTFLPHFNFMINALKFVFTGPMIVGELGLGLWLLFGAGKRPINSE